MSRVIAALIIASSFGSIGNGLNNIAESMYTTSGYVRKQIGPWYDFNYQWVKP